MFDSKGLHGELYGNSGMLRSLLQGSLGYVGMDVLAPFVAFHVPYITHEEREEILLQWKKELLAVDTRTVMRMPSLDEYDETFRRQI